MNRLRMIGLCGAIAALGSPGLATAQMAVIDVASVNQLVAEVQTLQQELATARGQLAQAQSEFQSITGGRGMGQLLSGLRRNYLPTDWSATLGAIQGSTAFPALSASVRTFLQPASVLSGPQLAQLPPAVAARLQTARQSIALLQGTLQQSLANSSQRFTTQQQLIDAIAATTDQKSVLELQARIAAENGMLQNEGTKLMVLTHAIQAQDAATEQQLRELAIAGNGQFAARLRPTP